MLDAAEIQEIHEAAIRADLAENRAALLGGIPRGVVAALGFAESPAARLLADLHGLNRAGSLSDGEIPLAIWLGNALLLAQGRVEAEVFRRARDHVLAAGPAAPLPPDRRAPRAAARPGDETILLERVRSFWIEGVLERSLNEELRIELAKDERPAAVDRGFELVVERLDENEQPLEAGVSIEDYFERRQRALLILGEPGAGKTIALLELTRALIARAEADPALPLPVVLSLSSWRDPKQPLAQWISEQLSDAYRVPRRVGRRWLESDRLALLFDGLDEVAPALRDECALALNRFREEHGLAPLAVACRREEYEALRRRLKLDAAIQLRALDDAQIDGYLATAGPRLLPLREALAADAGLKELARSPLMLSIMSLTYVEGSEGGEEAPAGSPAMDGEERRLRLFDRYVERMFRRREGQTRYSRGKTLRYLIWLAGEMAARGQSVFFLEHLSAASLRAGGTRLLYALVSRTLAMCTLPLMFGWWSEETAIFSLALNLCGPTLGLLDYALMRRPPASGDFLLLHLVAVYLYVIASTALVFGLVSGDLYRAFVEGAAAGGLLGIPFTIIFGRRRHQLAGGRDVQTVEGVGFYWRRLVVLAILLSVLPGGVGAYLLSSDVESNVIAIWNVESPVLRPTRLAERGRAHFAADGRVAVVRSWDDTLAIVDVATGRVEEPPIKGAVVFDADGRTAVNYDERSEGSNLRVLDARSWGEILVFRPPTQLYKNQLHIIDIGLAGRRVLSASLGSWWLHDTGNGKPIVQSSGGRVRITSDRAHVFAWDPWERAGGAPTLHGLETGEQVSSLAMDTSGIVDGDIHPGGLWLAALDRLGCLSRIDLTGAHEHRALPSPCLGPPDSRRLSDFSDLTRNPPAFVLFSPTGQRLFVLSNRNGALLDGDGALVARVALEERTVMVAFSREGGVFFERSPSRVRLYRSVDGATLGTIPLKASDDGGAELNHDGTRLLTWSIASDGREPALLVALFGLLVACALSVQIRVVRLKTRTNQGIHLTALWSLGLGCATAVFVGVVLYSVSRWTRLLNIEARSILRIGVLLGLPVAMAYGGIDILYHYTLRLMLALRGDLPLRAARFLDGATQQIFLRKVGGGYIFVHRLILEYFARHARRRLVDPEGAIHDESLPENAKR